MKTKTPYAFGNETDIEASARGEVTPVKNQAKMRAILKEAAVNYRTKKQARINIRLPEADLAGLKSRAEEEGIPYQTLIASVLHKFVNGRLTQKGKRA